jgi:hypothetical protein
MLGLSLPPLPPPMFWVSLYRFPQEFTNSLPSRHIETIPERENHMRGVPYLAGKNTDNTMKKNVEEMFLWKTAYVKIEQEESARI